MEPLNPLQANSSAGAYVGPALQTPPRAAAVVVDVPRQTDLECLPGTAGVAAHQDFAANLLPASALAEVVSNLDKLTPHEAETRILEGLHALGARVEEGSAGQFLRDMLRRLPEYADLETLGQRMGFKRQLRLALGRNLRGNEVVLDRILDAVARSEDPAAKLGHLELFIPGATREIMQTAQSQLRQGDDPAEPLRRLRDHVLCAWSPAQHLCTVPLHLGGQQWYLAIEQDAPATRLLLDTNWPGKTPVAALLLGPDPDSARSECLLYEHPGMGSGRLLHIAQPADRRCTLYAFNQMVSALGYHPRFMMPIRTLEQGIQEVAGQTQLEDFDSLLAAQAFNARQDNKLALWHARGGLQDGCLRFEDQQLDEATLRAEIGRATAVVLTTQMHGNVHSVTVCQVGRGQYMVVDPLVDPAGKGPGQRSRAILRAGGMCEAIGQVVEGCLPHATGLTAGCFEVVYSRKEVERSGAVTPG